MKKINVIVTLSNTSTGTVINKSVRNHPFVLTNGETVQLVNENENITVTAIVAEAENAPKSTHSVFSIIS